MTEILKKIFLCLINNLINILQKIIQIIVKKKGNVLNIMFKFIINFIIFLICVPFLYYKMIIIIF